MTERRRTKIVATLGPATSDYGMIEALFEAGVDVFRLNFSHGTASDHRRTAGLIRKLEAVFDRATCILGDLQGPKLRIGPVDADAVTLLEGSSFVLDQNEEPASSERAQLPHPEIFDAVSEGDVLLLDDGKIHLEVAAHTAESITTRVLTGGVLRSRKGVSLPGTLLSIPALTEKDRVDLEVALDIDVDWIAQSFVQRAEDVMELKELVDGRAGIVVKLEKPQALQNLQAIVELTDAVMVARGDLGVELSAEEVPPAQKEIIEACRAHGKPTIVATQMLESMIDSPTPTRAEASDVANAVYDGADAVMLSAETAVGAHPLEAVTVMDRIVRRIERDPRCRRGWNDAAQIVADEGTAAIVACIGLAAKRAKASSITSYTTSGATAFRVANVRPETAIVALTPSTKTVLDLWSTEMTFPCSPLARPLPRMTLTVSPVLILI